MRVGRRQQCQTGSNGRRQLLVHISNNHFVLRDDLHARVVQAAVLSSYPIFAISVYHHKRVAAIVDEQSVVDAGISYAHTQSPVDHAHT